MSEPHREDAGAPGALPVRRLVPLVTTTTGASTGFGSRRARLRRARLRRTGLALLSAAVLLFGGAVVGVTASEGAEATGPSTVPPASAGQPPPAQPAPPAEPAPPAAPVDPVVPEPPVPAQVAEPEVQTERPPSPPRRVSVQRLKIDTPLINLGLLENGELEVPAAFDIAGWHSNGTAPGEDGPAVIVGHVDSYKGPAIFYRVRELVPGDKITVDRADGSQVVFEVYGQETVPKDAFPTEKVYGETGSPELRLLTCGGRFNKKTKSYTDNVVVFARQIVDPVPA